MTLSGKQRRHLRALAHNLEPVIRVGHAGLTSGLVREIENALETHELIKVKLMPESPLEPHEAAAEIERATRSELAQSIGRILVVYRRRAKEPKIVLPGASSPA